MSAVRSIRSTAKKERAKMAYLIVQYLKAWSGPTNPSKASINDILKQLVETVE